ncbi:MAG: hypothetical protein ACYDA0_16080, partial [Candidatus Dormibacteraceae bacterium]
MEVRLSEDSARRPDAKDVTEAEEGENKAYNSDCSGLRAIWLSPSRRFRKVTDPPGTRLTSSLNDGLIRQRVDPHCVFE